MTPGRDGPGEVEGWVLALEAIVRGAEAEVV